MTRVRVLITAKKLLLAGYHPMSLRGCATDANNRIVAYSHPSAKKFTIVGAVQRAIYDLTGDDFMKRDSLMDASLDPLIKRSKSIHDFRNTFTTAPVEIAIKMINDQLVQWGENV